MGGRYCLPCFNCNSQHKCLSAIIEAKISLGSVQLLVDGSSFNTIERIVFVNHSAFALRLHILTLTKPNSIEFVVIIDTQYS